MRIQDHQIHPEFFGLIAEPNASDTERLSGDGGETFHPIRLTEEMFAEIVEDIEHWLASEGREYENLDDALRDLFFRQYGHRGKLVPLASYPLPDGGWINIGNIERPGCQVWTADQGVYWLAACDDPHLPDEVIESTDEEKAHLAALVERAPLLQSEVGLLVAAYL